MLTSYFVNIFSLLALDKYESLLFPDAGANVIVAFALIFIVDKDAPIIVPIGIVYPVVKKSKTPPAINP